MKKFVIDEKSVNGLFNFLVQYPFKDVYQVIDLLKSLKELPPENDEALED